MLKGKNFTFRETPDKTEIFTERIQQELRKQFNDDKIDSFYCFGVLFDKRYDRHKKYIVYQECIYTLDFNSSERISIHHFSASRSFYIQAWFSHSMNKRDKLYVRQLTKITDSNINPDDSRHQNFKSNKDVNLILATPDQFRLDRGESFINGSIISLDLEETTEVIKDDPIVLCPVENGFIIKTMWGPEAQLPELKDNSLN
jgi:hypothetical protein